MVSLCTLGRVPRGVWLQLCTWLRFGAYPDISFTITNPNSKLTVGNAEQSKENFDSGLGICRLGEEMRDLADEIFERCARFEMRCRREKVADHGLEHLYHGPDGPVDWNTIWLLWCLFGRVGQSITLEDVVRYHNPPGADAMIQLMQRNRLRIKDEQQHSSAERLSTGGLKRPGDDDLDRASILPPPKRVRTPQDPV